MVIALWVIAVGCLVGCLIVAAVKHEYDQHSWKYAAADMNISSLDNKAKLVIEHQEPATRNKFAHTMEVSEKPQEEAEEYELTHSR